MSSVNHSNCTDLTIDDTSCQIRPPDALGSNDHIPRLLYKEFPVAYLSVGVIVNCILIYYIIASKRYKSPLFTFIASLAIADAIACMGFVFRADIIYPVITLMCKVLMFIGNVSAPGSAYHLMYFAVLRYYQLCYPLYARARVTCGLVVNCCAFIWCLMVINCVVLIAVYQDAMPVAYEGEITHVCIFTGNEWALYLCFLVLSTSTPCIIIMSMHILKYIQMICTARKLESSQSQPQRQNTDARTITIVIILYLVCWFSANIYSMIVKHPPGFGFKQDKVYLILEYVISYNSTLNPIVYCIAAKTVRDDKKKFFSCKK